MDDKELVDWALQNIPYEKISCDKDRVYVVSCGTKTYTWIVENGVLFTTSQTKHSNSELANTIWKKNQIIHSFDEDIMLPFHALTDCTLIRCLSEDFDSNVKKNAKLSWLLAKHYHDQFANTLANFRHAALDPSETRLRYLEEMLGEIPELKNEKISDGTLALFMGMHRVSVNRIRKKIEQDKAKK